ncbi:polyketide synthase dehydratase domain-containing protein, partial [Streptomyces sp. B-S-A8]
SPEQSTTAEAAHLGLDPAAHGLLGAAVDLAGGRSGKLFTGRLSGRAQPWLAEQPDLDHRTPVPASVFVELGLHVGDVLDCAALETLTIHAPLLLDEGRAAHLQVVTAPTAAGDGRHTFSVHARPEGLDAPWTLHAEGLVGHGTISEAPPAQAWPPAGAEEAEAGEAHELALQDVTALWRHEGDVHAELMPTLDGEFDTSGFLLHPLLWEWAAQLARYAADSEEVAQRAVMSWSGVRVYAEGADVLRVSVRRTDKDVFALHLADHSGRTVATVDAITLGEAVPEQPRPGGGEALYRVDWTPAALPEATSPIRWGSLGGQRPADLATLDPTAVDAVLVPVGPADGLSGGEPGDVSGGVPGGVL